ncbi:hypothetical protein [Amycolatopsis thermophila]|uniref:Uncharacterized protein n=1 Tax=Amycolatopsis thermophila TaxID=206084 RepID=A0ABU0EX23_9PSEU|nr:hypothetical protein [Amycolatopsis thermophila]MDQ0379862.1 hypothetical protein [Amycolatopsis thermophila]
MQKMVGGQLRVVISAELRRSPEMRAGLLVDGPTAGSRRIQHPLDLSTHSFQLL